MNELISRTQISDLVKSYDLSKANLTEAMALVRAAEDFRDSIMPPDSQYSYRKPTCLTSDRNGGLDANTTLKASLDELKLSYWQHIHGLTNIRQLLTPARQKEMDEQMNKPADLPEINLDNINSTLMELRANTAIFLQETVEEVFQYLIPGRHQEHKTPKRHMVGQKCIITNFYSDYWSTFNHWHRDKIKSFFMVISILSGEGFKGKIMDELLLHLRENDYSVNFEHEYFTIKRFKNENAHIIWKPAGDFIRNEINKRCAKAELFKAS